MLRLEASMLHQEMRTLVLELRTRKLHRCTIWEHDSNRLTELREAVLHVASEMLARKTHLTLAILLHFLQLVLNDDGLVNQMLKIWVVSVEQLKLDLVLETLEKRVLHLLVSVDVVGGVPLQLSELVQILIHHHASLV
jgi:hypothetical protein